MSKSTRSSFGPDDPDFVTALARGLELLRMFETNDRFLGNGELAARANLPKSTVARLTKTLTWLGYLEYIPRLEKYQLGVGVLSLGYALLSDLEVVRLAAPAMRELADYGNVNIGLAARDRLDMIYLETALGGGNHIYQLGPGVRVPIQSTALGFAYLNKTSNEKREEILASLKAVDGSLFSKISQDLKRTAKELDSRGFCIAEWQSDIVAAAVPLVDSRGDCHFVFNCGGPKFMLSRERLIDDLGPRLFNLVANVRRQLPDGWR